MTTKRHIELVEAVNNAKTKKEHDKAEVFLRGWRDGFESSAGKLSLDLCGCDMYYIDQGIDRPMCCGVWLDWKPQEPTGDTSNVGE